MPLFPVDTHFSGKRVTELGPRNVATPLFWTPLPRDTPLPMHFSCRNTKVCSTYHLQVWHALKRSRHRGSRLCDKVRHPTLLAAECTGVEHVYDLGEMNDYEKEGLKEALVELKDSIQKGVDFANK